MLLGQFKLNMSQIDMVISTPTPHFGPVSVPAYMVSVSGSHRVPLLRKGGAQSVLGGFILSSVSTARLSQQDDHVINGKL